MPADTAVDPEIRERLALVLDVDDLVVAEAYVGKALVMKRFSARARGRSGRIEKPFSHLTIVLREVAAAAQA